MTRKTAHIPASLVRAARRQRIARMVSLHKARWAFRFQKLRRAAIAFALIFSAAIVSVIVLDKPATVAFLLTLLATASFIGLALFPSAKRRVPASSSRDSLEVVVADAVERLEARRRGLPAPALGLIDVITMRLTDLGPQLGKCPDDAQEAQDLQRIVSTHLPHLLDHHARVPFEQRNRRTAGGLVPDEELTEGLAVICEQIDAIARALSRADIDRLAIQNRYLESRYSSALTGT